MAFHLIFDQVCFSHESTVSVLFENLSLDFPPGWTGIVGPNGSGKSTLLHLATRRLEPDSGTIRIPRTVAYCPQRTDQAPAALKEMLTSSDPEAWAIASRLGMAPDWPVRWNQLSHGERKRAQIGVALWQNPDILAIDEPTNHIDAGARELLIASLENYQGIGLLVSHDRELLDRLIHQCLFIETPRAIMRPGNYSRASEERGREHSAIRAEQERLVTSYRKLEREFKRRRTEADRAEKRRSNRHINPHDNDARGRQNRAVVSGKDGKAGRLLSQMKGRLGQLEAQRNARTSSREFETGIWVEAEPARRPTLVDLEPGEIPLDGRRFLRHPQLTISRSDRIALVGPNGCGKSTLLRFIIESLDWPEEKLLLLPQEITSKNASSILDQVRLLPRRELGQVMQTISRLGSRPDRLLESGQPSPGEIRKLLIALGIRRRPWMIVMDEPTNHLDLPSIECLENALKDCPCALLLVSHDHAFLNALTTTHWSIDNRENPVLEIR
ncbi:MAG: ATP-binding cassette domain-containing protein [Opitutaceae bacterium]